MIPAHPLDRPVWSALTTRQRPLAIGDERALRFSPDYGPFAAAADDGAASQASLAALIQPRGGMVLVELTSVDAPPGARLVSQAPARQMVAGPIAPDDGVLDIVDLGEVDATEMLALAQMTKPGPFGPLTHRMGEFFGVRRGGVLAAMAGERMTPAGYTEVSAVCTHPDHRGRGYGAALTRRVASRIQARGETAFLHVMAQNENAVRLYRTLGFSIRQTLVITALAPQRVA